MSFKFKTSQMTDEQFQEFVRVHPVSGACGTHGAENNAAAQQSAFTSQMTSQASQVFGADNGTWNAMQNAYSQLLAAGPSQHGFSAAQLSAMNSAAITSGANTTRGIEAMIGGKQAGAGGGNAPNASGIGISDRAKYAEAVAGQTAGILNANTQADYAQGNKNWQNAGEGIRSAPGVYSNLSGVDSAAQTGLDRNMENAQAADAASNWWIKPVAGAVAAGAAFIPGAGGVIASQVAGGFAKGLGSGGGQMAPGSQIGSNTGGSNQGNWWDNVPDYSNSGSGGSGGSGGDTSDFGDF